MELGSLPVGHTLLEEELVVSPEASEAYLAAVGDASAVYRGAGLCRPWPL